ncbi:oligosaccharide flippase family protein [Streptococcus castoreus]|uniref:oligosaccharide flippase family protein n=1 Tax=Streptococcus castoreus TaxID=254786 RepID=UPI00047F395F|nr:oligosaccharide flippase family protein [Streptococcus castoreus]
MKLNLEKQSHHFRQTSLLMTISGLVSKILAATYRIPYQNLVGDRGFYAYQQIYPFLAIISTLSLTALPNLIASMAQKKNNPQIASFLKLQLIVSLGLSFILFLGHQQIAWWIGTPQLGTAIYLTSLVLLTVPLISFYRGVAQAEMNMTLTAVSQMIEQVIRVTIIMIAAICYVIFDWTIYVTANVAVAGNLMGSLVVLIYLRRKSFFSFREFLKKSSLSFKSFKHLGLSSLIFIIFSIYLFLFQLLDSLFIKNSLVSAGYSNQLAEISKGIYDRGQSLIQFGLIFSTALFTSYLPKLTRLYHHNKIAYKVQSQDFFAFIFYFNVTLTTGFMSILHLMNLTLFEDNKGWAALMFYLVIIVISSMIQFFHQKCFIENQMRMSFIILLIGIGCKLGLTPLLTYYYGILGSSLSTLISLIIVLLIYVWLTSINWAFLCNGKFWVALVLMLMMVLIGQSIIPLQGRLEAFISLILSTGIGLFSFLIICRKLGAFNENLWSFLPFRKEK